MTRSEERRVGKECRSLCDWSSDVCSSDLFDALERRALLIGGHRKPLVDWRDRGQEGRGVLPDDRQYEIRIELGEQNEPGAHAHREREAERESIRVEHRQYRID